jgi:hypothetical protein
MNLPPPWEAYLRLQTELAVTNQLNGRNWGLEAALDAILTDPPLPTELPTTIATAERRERHRARLRRTYPSSLSPAVDQTAAIEARAELDQIRRLLLPSDWQLITNVAMGKDYRAMAKDLGATPGSLRVRVTRIRADLSLAA